jgi:hypothetical protein
LTKHTILFLAANPLGIDRLTLDEEARAIQEELERSGHRDKFELVTRWAVRPLDLLRELRKLKPTVVHFSGHGGCGEPCEPPPDAGARQDVATEPGAVDADHQHGLFFQGSDGGPQLVSTAALEETFGAAGSSVKLVVLNACYSAAQAEALLAHVRCVIGMCGSVSEEAARNFAIGLYGGLAERESVGIAYKQGRAAISLDGVPDSGKPRLIVRNTIDAQMIIVADANPDITQPGIDASPVQLAQLTYGRTWGEHQGTITKPATAGENRQVSDMSLRVLTGKHQGAVIPLPFSGVVRIGRTSGLDVTLVDDLVSRIHAHILISCGNVSIADQGSTNGTFVNGHKIGGCAVLRKGDRVLVGMSIMRLDVAAGPGPSLEDARQTAEKHMPTPGRPISGVLEEIPLLDLLQLLSTSHKSGVLAVNNGARLGKIYLRKGAMYFATIDGDFAVSPQKSLYRMLTWLTGTYELEPGVDLHLMEEVHESTETLLMEGVRHLNEFRKLQKQLPPLRSALAVPSPLAGKLRGLSAPELDTFQLVLEHGQLQRVLDNFPGTDVDAAQHLISLMTREFVVVP